MDPFDRPRRGWKPQLLDMVLVRTGWRTHGRVVALLPRYAIIEYTYGKRTWQRPVVYDDLRPYSGRETE